MAEPQIYEVFIRTTPEKLWQALTDGELTKNYFFGEIFQSKWTAGSLWHSAGADGNRHVEGKVQKSEPPHLLTITWHVLYDPELSTELSKVTYLIEERGGVCKLTVTHELTTAPKTAKSVGKDGWSIVLSGLKTLLETGEPMPIPEGA
jgi:uncharacterized protein YndB with AHSA1/START domain